MNDFLEVMGTVFIGAMIALLIILGINGIMLEKSMHPSQFVDAPYCEKGACWSCVMKAEEPAINSAP